MSGAERFRELGRVRGRPTTFAPERADVALDLWTSGLTLRKACRAAGVAKSTLQGWALADRGGLAERYRQAQIIRAIELLDEAFEIAEDGSRDWIEGPHGPVLDHAHLRRCEARINFRVWYADRVLPARLGGRADAAERRSIEIRIVD